MGRRKGGPLISLICLWLSACAQTQAQWPDRIISRVHSGGALRLAFSPAGDQLISGGYHGELAIWSLAESGSVARWQAHPSKVLAIAWLPQGDVVSADRDTIRVWRPPKAQPSDELPAPELNALVGVSATGLYSGHQDGSLRRYALAPLRITGQVQLDGPVRSLAVRSGDGALAVALQDGRVFLFDAALLPLPLHHALPPLRQTPQEMRFSPDGGKLYVGTWRHVWIYEFAREQWQQRLTEHFGSVVSLDVDPSGRYLVSLGRVTDSSLRVTDAETGYMVRRLAPHALCGWQVRFSPDGRYVASAAEDGSLHLYDLSKPYQPLPLHLRPGTE